MKKTESNERSNFFSECMRTKNGQTAAVCCLAKEKKHADLYAYAYVHAILTFFRRIAPEKIFSLSKSKIASLLLSCCVYSVDKMDKKLCPSAVHLIPSIAGFVTTSDGNIICFAFGDGVVTLINDTSETEIKLSHFQRTLINSLHLTINSLSSSGFIRKDIKTCGIKRICLNTGSNKQEFGHHSFSIPINSADQETGGCFKAVITGKNHSEYGNCCQDYAEIKKLPDGKIALALSDGASGGNFSEYGAIMNVSSFIKCAEECDDPEQLKTSVINEINFRHRSLQMKTPEGDMEKNGGLTGVIEDYATLLGVKVDQEHVMLLHIGDGVIYAQKVNGEIDCVSEAKNTLSSNHTHFTIEPDAFKHTSVETIARCEYTKLLVMTDGVYNSYSKEELPSFVENIFKKSDDQQFNNFKLAELIDTPEIEQYGDDHSAIIVNL